MCLCVFTKRFVSSWSSRGQTAASILHCSNVWLCVLMCVWLCMLLESKHWQKSPFLFACMYVSAGMFVGFCVSVYLNNSEHPVCLCARVTYSSVVSLGMPLGRECSPLLLHRTTPSVHVQTSGQPDAGRQPLSSAPGERGMKETESGILDKEKEGEGRKGYREGQTN